MNAFYQGMLLAIVLWLRATVKSDKATKALAKFAPVFTEIRDLMDVILGTLPASAVKRARLTVEKNPDYIHEM